jgi:hypothetical protein
MAALVLMLESAEAFSVTKFNLAALLLGLSIAACLAATAPAIALAAVFLAWGRGWLYPKGRGVAFAGILFLTVFVFLVIPFYHVDKSNFAGAATSLRETLNRIIALSVGTSSRVVAGTFRVAVAVVAGVSMVAAVRFRRSRWDGAIVLTGGSFTLTLIVLLAAHRWLHAPFPKEGGLLLIPLLILSLSSLFIKLNVSTAQFALCGAGILFIGGYLTAADIMTYAGNEEFAGGRALAKTLRAAVGPGGISLGASEDAEPIINYYRTRLRQGNWERVPHKPPTDLYDYYVLTGNDRRMVEERHLRVVYRDASLILAR